MIAIEDEPDWFEVAERIDRLAEEGLEVTDWEADFLESILRQKGGRLSEKQVRVLRRMREKYLQE